MKELIPNRTISFNIRFLQTVGSPTRAHSSDGRSSLQTLPQALSPGGLLSLSIRPFLSSLFCGVGEVGRQLPSTGGRGAGE
jgi:hypothetical protein